MKPADRKRVGTITVTSVKCRHKDCHYHRRCGAKPIDGREGPRKERGSREAK